MSLPGMTFRESAIKKIIQQYKLFPNGKEILEKFKRASNY